MQSHAAPSPLAGGDGRPLGGIDVRSLARHPRLTLLQRQGDPAATVALAVATAGGSVDNTALGALIAARLGAAGHPVRFQADALGLRLTHTLSEEHSVATFLDVVVQALNKPLQPDETRRFDLQRDVASLYAHPLDAPALGPIAACSGQAGVIARAAPPDYRKLADRARLEALRRKALVVERMGLGVVGPAPVTGPAAAALAASRGWRSGARAEPAWPGAAGEHGAYRTATLGLGGARLHLALRTPSALGAVGAAQRLAAQPSPLSVELDALPVPWRLTAVHATAHPVGGCLALQLAPRAPLAAQRVAVAAAEVAAVVRGEVLRQLDRPESADVLSRQLLAAPTATIAAALAAWWAVAGSRVAEASSVMSSALAVGAAGRGGSGLGDEALSASYRAALAAAATPARPRSATEIRLAVEPGQGQLWVLVGSPCALTDEGSWDAGRAALGAAAAAATVREPGVTVLPWVSAAGVGVLAYGQDEGAAGGGGTLAERVARAGGRAFGALALGEGALDGAKRRLLAQLDGPRLEAYFAFAARAAPGHPSWLAPWGAPERWLATSATQLDDRRRELVHGPVRIAVLANRDEQQAEAAAREVRRWLVDAGVRPSCPATTAAGAPQPGEQTVAGRPEGGAVLLVGAPLPARPPQSGPGFAEQLVAALAADAGLARRLFGTAGPTMRVLGGGSARAVVLELHGPPSGIEALKQRALAGLATLRTDGLPESLRQRLPAISLRASRRRRARPSDRIGALWRGAPAHPQRPAAIAADGWHRWLAHTFAPPHLIVIMGKPKE